MCTVCVGVQQGQKGASHPLDLETYCRVGAVNQTQSSAKSSKCGDIIIVTKFVEVSLQRIWIVYSPE